MADLALPADFDSWSLDRKNEFIKNLKFNWDFWARPTQKLPSLESEWKVWMILSGRGWGKTRTGAEAIKKLMLENPGCRVGIVGMTAGAVRDTCYEGEALDITTELFTARGWSTMGDLVVGDRVYASDGTLTDIEWVSDIYNDRPCYRVTLSDGSVINADAQHKWYVHTEQAGYRVQTTQEMAIAGVRRGRMYHWSVNAPVTLKTPSVIPTIDPYCLGYWLGDGTAKNGNITTMDSEVIARFEAAGYKTRAYEWGSRGKAQTYGVYKFQTDLRQLKLLNSKHVPDEVWHWSTADRLNFIQGMMDSDGDVTERGQCAFNNTNYKLIAGLHSILSSVGVRVSLPNKPHTSASQGVSDSWRLSFTTDLPVVGLLRKSKNQIVADRSRDRAIVSIESVQSVPVRCISVKHASHVFLVGRSFIPTHNSGLLAVIPPEMYSQNGGKYNKSLGQLTLSNGSKAFGYSGADPEKLRGFQSNFLWMDELCAFSYAQEAWDMAMMGLRLGKHPRIIITTTPKPSPLIIELVRRGVEEPDNVILTTGSTFDNSANLPQSTLDELRKRYEGTTMGRQELYAELILDDPGALWKRANIEDLRISVHDFDITKMQKIVVAIDPSMSAVTERESETGMIVAGLGLNGHAYIIEDCSALRPSPDTWSKLAIAKYHEYAANRIVAEVNQGYDLVTNLLNTHDDTVPVKKVYATRGGKFLRAEPIAALYEQNRVHHVGLHPKLEDQMTQWIPGKASPDRLDAMVWALTDLMLGGGVAEYFSPNTLGKLPGMLTSRRGLSR